MNRKINFFFAFFNFVGSILANYEYELALCAIFQNEARFMKEWIEFHKLVGVEHFYLYNNNSTDNYLEVLKPYIEKNEVELVDWGCKTITKFQDKTSKNQNSANKIQDQMSAYQNAISKAKRKVKWLAILDLDEFLYPVKKKSLVDFLRDYEQFGGVCVNWFMFGTSNVTKIPEYGIMIKYLTKCDATGNLHVKSIIRPDKVIKMRNPHCAQFIKGAFQVTPEKIKFTGPFSPKVSKDKIRINHYWTRDNHYFINTKIPRIESSKEKGRAQQNWYLSSDIAEKMSPTEWAFAINRIINKDIDKTILRYLKPLKKRLKKRRYVQTSN